jgi:hypothetical protein
MAEKGGFWKLTLQVNVPISVHESSSSLSESVDEAFSTLFLPKKPGCLSLLSSVEICISRDAAKQWK